ncbi:hypothetical protein BTO30_14895 [Domibacillus antri]|uniref:Phage tail protein n=1 Tax=Domibacillus antri TaxID=1714264 RepID=A0A1Q8Q271_9BACI|nr:phage tail protein [Domibacillus antri]OLN21405.1 hypothetical protein BTO30_14895 [Domibacillus antri]
MITLTVEQLEKARAALIEVPNGLPKAVMRAVNRSAQSARTEAGRAARQEYHIKQADVTSTIRIHRASMGDFGASVVSKGSVIPLIKFRVNPKAPNPKRKRPITARVKKGGGGPIPGAFVAQMRSGYIGVFSRVGKPRLPIEQLYGPSIPQMLGSDTVSAWVENKAYDTLQKRLDHEISRLVGGAS